MEENVRAPSGAAGEKREKEKPKRFRLTVPAGDVDVLEWINGQENLSMSIRCLVTDYVNRFGDSDAVYNGVGRTRCLYGAPPKRSGLKTGRPEGSRDKAPRKRKNDGEQGMDARPVYQAEAVPAPVPPAVPVYAPPAPAVTQPSGSAVDAAMDDGFDDMAVSVRLPDYSKPAEAPVDTSASDVLAGLLGG